MFGCRLLALGVLLGVFATLPLATDAQQASSVRRIGFLRVGTLPASQAFLDALRERSWIEGRNIRLEPRYARDASELTALATELVKLHVDVIVTNGTPATRAARQATSTIPIVFFLAADPVRNGIVQSLARPGVNATGFAYGLYEHKRLEILKATMPALVRVAYSVVEGVGLEMNPEFVQGASALALQVQGIDVGTGEDLAPFFAAARDAGAEAILIPDVPRLLPDQRRIGGYASGAGMPAIGFAREFVEGGGLLYYGPVSQHWPRLASQIDRILRGANPAELPVEQASKFELVVNLKTAKELGLEIPQSIVMRAVDVIR